MMPSVLRRASGAILLVMLLCGAAVPSHAADATSSASPPFVLKDLDGKTLKFTDLKGHPVVLDFWATWCQPCRAAMPHLDAIQSRYAEKGLVVVGVSVDDGGPQRVKRFVDHLGVKFRMTMADDRVLDQFGPIRSIPTTFFIDRKGQITRRVVGSLDEDTMASYAEELLAN